MVPAYWLPNTHYILSNPALGVVGLSPTNPSGNYGYVVFLFNHFFSLLAGHHLLNKVMLGLDKDWRIMHTTQDPHKQKYFITA